MPDTPLAVAPPAPVQLPIEIGARVAVVPSPDARYAVVSAGAGETHLEVMAGAVTARLYPGDAAHRLRGIEATATGTIYTLAVPAGGAPRAVVHRGSVRVVDEGGQRTVAAGEGWPLGNAGEYADAAASLAKYQRTVPTHEPAPAAMDAG